MGNADEIARPGRPRTELFLGESGLRLAEKPELYDLEEQFSKTGQTRNLRIPLLILGFLVVTIGAAIAVTSQLQRNSLNVAIDISDFEDANLKELLDTARKNDLRLETARAELQAIRDERDKQISTRQDDLSQQRELAAVQLEGSALQTRLNNIQAELERVVLGITADFADRIAAQEQVIADIQAELAQYDSVLIEEVKRQEEILNNEMRGRELQFQERIKTFEQRIASLQAELTQTRTAMDEHSKNIQAQLQDNYGADRASLIATFDPQFVDAEVISILGEELRPEVELALAEFDMLLEQNDIISEVRFRQLTRDVEASVALVDRMDDIPYNFDMARALEQLRIRLTNVVDVYEGMRVALTDGIKAREQELGNRATTIELMTARLAGLDYALATFVTDTREQGYLVDARDPADVAFVVRDARLIADGLTGLVFRNQDQFVGRLRFSVTDSGISATFAEAPRIAPRPFDKILLQLR